MPQGPQASTLRLLALLGLGCTLGAALPDVPTPDNFLHRSWATATVLGDYVYIDGGEISQIVDGESRGADVVNSTLSIDMSKSWKSLDVTIRTIPKTGPAKTNVGLWTDTAAGAFYSWGGRWPGGKNITKNALWKFTADGKGGGSWAADDPGNPTLFNGMHQTEYGAFVNTDTTGFVIGGAAHAWTEMDHYTADPIPGMVSFDMKSKIWQNGTTNFSPYDSGVLNKASAVYLPAIGPNGLIITFGGYAPPVDSDLNKSDGSPLDLRNLTLFNPETKKRYWQTATGTVPPTPRGQFCTVAFPTSDGGYDIFLFGGTNGRDQFDYGDAYVLSTPGFVWTKLPDPPGGKRTGASCVRVGKRQVLSIGGSDGSSKADPAPQGLLLFDMTSLEWKDSYDANAAAYERSKTVQEWYDNNKLDKVDWSSDEFQKLFVAASASATATNTDATSTPPPTGGAPGSTSTSDPEVGSSSTPVGAIVGGVVGGIAGLAAIGVAAWFILRRRKQQQTPENPTDPTQPSELDPNQQLTHGHQQYPPHATELDPNSPYSQNTTAYTPNMAVGGYYGYKEKEGSEGPPPAELSHHVRPSELGAGINHYELDSTPLR